MKELTIILVLVGVFGAFFVPVCAQPMTIIIDVEALSPNPGLLWGSAPVYTDIDWTEVYNNPDETFTWYLEEPIIIKANNEPEITLATILGINLSVKADPVVEIGFAVAAGKLRTHFNFTSDVLSFGSVINPDARAYASVTPNQGDTVDGDYEFGTKACRAIYNGSEVFANLVDTPATWPIAYEDTGW